MNLQVGTRLKGEKSSCEVIVVKGSATDGTLLCAGAEMVPGGAGGQSDEGPMIELGKRYSDDVSGIELLCTKAGVGPLALDGRVLALKASKPLPASD